MQQIKFKKVHLLELANAYQKVQQWFFDNPTKEVSLSDLVELVNISKTSANRAVAHLKEEGFLNVIPLGRIWRISCNQQHEYNISRKVPYHLELVYASGLIGEIRSQIPNLRSMSLFGSYRRGDDIEQSDIDIAVEILGDEETKTIEFGHIPQMGYRENVRVNIVRYTRERVDLNLFANIANGIVLYGFLEVGK